MVVSPGCSKDTGFEKTDEALVTANISDDSDCSCNSFPVAPDPVELAKRKAPVKQTEQEIM